MSVRARMRARVCTQDGFGARKKDEEYEVERGGGWARAGRWETEKRERERGEATAIPDFHFN